MVSFLRGTAFRGWAHPNCYPQRSCLNDAGFFAHTVISLQMEKRHIFLFLPLKMEEVKKQNYFKMKVTRSEFIYKSKAQGEIWWA